MNAGTMGGCSQRRTRARGRLAGALGLLCLGALGCDDAAKVHAFYSSPYYPETDCLGALMLSDVLDGPDPGICNQVVCWMDQRGNAYLSQTMCDGPPDWTRVEKPGPGTLCEAALAALARWGVGGCAPDAGVEAENEGNDDQGEAAVPDDGG